MENKTPKEFDNLFILSSSYLNTSKIKKNLLEIGPGNGSGIYKFKKKIGKLVLTILSDIHIQKSYQRKVKLYI